MVYKSYNVDRRKKKTKLYAKTAIQQGIKSSYMIIEKQE